MALHVVALAGGAGTRLWPLSTREHPKQLVSIFGGQSLLQRTMGRLPASVTPEQRWVVMGADQLRLTQDALRDLPAEQFLSEPEAKNTAAAIFLAAQRIYAREPDAVIAVLPADQFIDDEDAFQQALMDAVAMSKQHGLVVLGVRPTRPETGYGYIELGAESGAGFVCARFVEKPDQARAESYLSGGRHLWNAGMFVFGYAALAREAESQMQATWRAFEAWGREGCDAGALAALYAEADPLSFDYGIMEGAGDVGVIALDAGWSDVGSYQSLFEALAGPAGSYAYGAVIEIDGAGNLLINMSDAPLAVLGIRDCVVVQSPEGTAVLPLAKSQGVRDLVAALPVTSAKN